MGRYVVEILDQTGPDALATRGYVGPGGCMVRSMHRAAPMDLHDATALIASIRSVCPQLVLRARPCPAIAPASALSPASIR